MKDLGLYIHIPFCRSKCYYCDFNSYENKEYLMGPYVDALIKELDFYKHKNFYVNSIYFGGGTPSYISVDFMEKIFEKIFSSFAVNPKSEITIEINPGTINREKLLAYKSLGINRLSMGLQSIFDHHLKILGRIHTYREFEENYFLSRDLGFNNINIDLIFAIPFQTYAEWMETLKRIAGLKPEHISCYELKIEEGTPFKKLYDENKLDLPDEDANRSMYAFAKEFLKEKGYTHYEISNFAVDGFECAHNLIYWGNKEYIGIGAGAHSFIDKKRFHNFYDICKYIDTLNNGLLPVEDIEEIHYQEEIFETIMLGLRLLKGIDKKVFEHRFGKDIYAFFRHQIEKLIDQGLIVDDGDFIKLTDRGIDVSNNVIVEFL